MLQDEYCKTLCQVDIKTKDVTNFKLAIKRQYHHNWIIDNLPAASILDTEQYVTTQFVGFPVGYQEGVNYFIYNHVNIILEYHTVEEDGHRLALSLCFGCHEIRALDLKNFPLILFRSFSNGFDHLGS
jgi:transmembrane 9 superfamily protein 2/4